MDFDKLKKKLEGYGYLFFSRYYHPKTFHQFFRWVKSPNTDSYIRDVGYDEMLKLLEAEEKIRLRSKKIQNILGYDNE
jgi:hypothetical protein